MKIPLILVNRLLNGGGAFDALSMYLTDAIITDFNKRYHDVILLEHNGLIAGSIGGDTSFKHLPHRGVYDNCKRFGLDLPERPKCINCGGDKLAICHKIPRIFGGNLTPFNLYVDCSKCNSLQRDVLTPQQILLLLPYSVNVDLSINSIRKFINTVSGVNHE
jgi:hypothetical protein